MSIAADWQCLQLHGRALIEASAGTGKTWTLSALYLRLLLEQQLGPRQIVVGTFTEAAAQELRERIRARLRRSVRRLQNGPNDEGDPIDRWLDRLGEGRERHQQRLQLALSELDRAPIGTLHGLCRRILGEHALATDSGLQPGELVSESALRSEVVDDLWRGLTQGEPTLDPARQDLVAAGRAALLQAMRALDDPSLKILAPDPAQLAALEQINDPAWVPRLRQLAARRDYLLPRARALGNELERLAVLIESGDLATAACDSKKLQLAALAEGDLHSGALARQIAAEFRDELANDPTLQFAIRAARLLLQYPRILRGTALAAQAVEFRRLAARRKLERNLLTYSDLIEGVHLALSRDDNGLADALAKQWPAALIDEFQDTDPRQYGIFDRIYRDAQGHHRGLLMMIGDPKQAIYRFRGGDIHTYQRAAAVADQRLSLAVNQRSSRALVSALNTLYARHGDGFRIPPGPGHFDYVRIEASGRRDDQIYSIDGQPCPRPLIIHALPLTDTPASVEQRRELALDSCADAIADCLLSGDHRIGEHALKAGDIAVLLPKNEHILALRDRLRRRGVPSAGAGRSNVFATVWAESLQLVLWAALHPHDAGAVRAALLSPLMGLNLTRLRSLQAQPDAWSAELGRFAQMRSQWSSAGVLALITPLIEAAAPRLLADAERGERALTDLRHLGELLAAADSQSTSAEATWTWLVAQRRDIDAEGDAAEERQLRIESDRSRVQLMTLHASKGLEFKLVFLPLMWDQLGRDTTFPTCPDPAGGRIVDLGSENWEQAREEAALEDQRERLRVLYVALTRAVHGCQVWALDPQRPANARQKQALSDPQRSALDVLLEPLFEADRSGNPLQLEAMNWRRGWPQSNRRTLPTPTATAPRRPRGPLPAMRSFESLVSFSSLTHGRGAEVVRAGDEIERPAAVEPGNASVHPELQAWDRVRGVAIGNALHNMFERREIGQSFSAQSSLIQRSLRAQGLESMLSEARWIDRISQRLDAVLDADLGGGLRLGAVPASAQRAEMDFRLRLDGVSTQALRQVCELYGDASLLPPQITARSLRGMLSGKIDLVFEHNDQLHILDYKSNRLGPRLADYDSASLQAAMDASGYRFQALLYSVAVHRYLAQRRADYQPQRHLGEAWYLFVRAVGLAPAVGVWRHRFAWPLIEAVDAVLAAEPNP